MKLDKERIAKIKSNIEVDLEFSQEARQECKSFEPFDYDDIGSLFYNGTAPFDGGTPYEAFHSDCLSKLNI